MPKSSTHCLIFYKGDKTTEDDHTMTKRYAVIFPGQGSQALGMMSEFRHNKTVATTFEQASDALGLSLWQVLDDERIHDTKFTQPVILTASIALWRLLIQDLPDQPSYLAGHSLGEYSALVAAGVLDFDDAIKLVHERGKYMTQAVADMPTQMLAVLGLGDDEVLALCQGEMADVANFNSPGQVVVAGSKDGVAAVLAKVQSLGKKAVPLKVSVPSHCYLMKPAAKRLSALLADTAFGVPSVPIIQNLTACTNQDPKAIKDALICQLSEPVQWTKTMDKLAKAKLDFVIECGFGNVLTNLAKRQSAPLPVYGSDKMDKLDKIKALWENK